MKSGRVLCLNVWISPFFLELILAQAIYGVEATRPYSSAIELALSCMSLYGCVWVGGVVAFFLRYHSLKAHTMFFSKRCGSFLKKKQPHLPPKHPIFLFQEQEKWILGDPDLFLL